MKKFLAVITPIACIIGLPAPAEATGITYDCDTAANHYSELVLPAVGGRFTVSGNVQLIALAEVSKYTPLARIQISSPSEPGKSPASFAGVAVMALPADAKETSTGSAAIQMVAFNANGKDDEIVPLSMLAKPGGTQSFSLAFDAGMVVASIGNESRTLSVKTPEPVVRIVCSTGEFLFTNLIIQPAQ
jgi:hypothetical protein